VTDRPSWPLRLGLAAAVLAAGLAATALGLRPPAARPADAPAGEFSAGRARTELAGLLAAAGGGPHPVTSTANRRVREFVLRELSALGVAPEVHESVACGRYRFCAPVSNVVARVRGKGPGRPVLLVAHYDSVPAGPGAADDGSGVAILLESARALAAERPARDVLLLVDDGEEVGLAGAEAFVKSPLASEVGAVVNVEARGTSGPSLLFETAGPSGFVASRLAGGPGLLTSSLFSTFYALLPNDTDLTALRPLSVPGVNLAFIGGACRYHTPEDDLAHLDPRSLQHQGEGALRLVRSFAAADLERVPPGEAIFFDVLGLGVVRLPAGAALGLALAALAACLLASRRAVRRGAATARGVALGAAALPACLAAALASGYVAARALGLSAVQRPWVAHPLPLQGAFLACAVAAAALPAALLAGRTGAAGFRAGVALGLAAAAAALGAALPGASYVVLAPALLAPVAVAASRRPSLARALDAAVALCACSVLLPAAWLLYPAMGHGAGPIAAAAAAVAILPLAPMLADLPVAARRAGVAVPALTALALALVARAEPQAGPACPERVVVYFHEDSVSGRARLLASSDLGQLPPAVRAAADFSAAARVRFGWAGLRPAFEAPAPPLGLPGPELAVEEISEAAGRIHVRGRLASRRGAPTVQVAIPPDVQVESFAFDGEAVPQAAVRTSRWFGRWSVFRRLGAPPEGVEVEMVLVARAPVALEIADESPGLPPAGARVAVARDGAAVTAQEGDVTLFTRTHSLVPH